MSPPHRLLCIGASLSGLLGVALGFQSITPTSLHNQHSTLSALSAVKNNDEENNFSLDRRSVIATSSAAVLTSLSLMESEPANAFVPAVLYKHHKNSHLGNNSDRKIPTWRLDGGVEFPILALNTAGLS